MKDITVLEVSYEAANKVGGIYTVLVSKMLHDMYNVKDYYAIGPYFDNPPEFTEEAVPAGLQKVFSAVERSHGIKCYYGRWLIEGRPATILVDFRKMKKKADKIKYELWERYKIDSWGSDDWFNEPVVWSKCAGILIEEMIRSGFIPRKTVVHFHEWLSGAGLLHLKSRVNVPTVFTTHSTVMGRTIAEIGKEDLYALINEGMKKGETVRKEKVYEYKMQSKHLMERECALNSTVFTTVSETMATECEFMLGRKADLILHNGLDMKKFPSQNEVFRMHDLNNQRIKNFLMGYFLPYYDIETDDALICFISGRHEFHNKGIDIFIDALGRLNERLKKECAERTLVAFIWVPTGNRGKKPTAVEHLKLFENVEDAIEGKAGTMDKEMLKSFLRGEIPGEEKVFGSKFMTDLKKLVEVLSKRKDGNPPITPFDVDDNNITQAIILNNLLNRPDDRVKVIYYPAYISDKDGLLGMKYYNAMGGCDIGVFPSYYESWGYTPLETAALGLQSVTTDLSGFGKFVQPLLKKKEMSIMVMKRDGKDDKSAVRELEDMFYRIYTMGDAERDRNRKRAKELSMLADWGNLFENYLKAYELALGRF